MKIKRDFIPGDRRENNGKHCYLTTTLNIVIKQHQTSLFYNNTKHRYFTTPNIITSQHQTSFVVILRQHQIPLFTSTPNIVIVQHQTSLFYDTKDRFLLLFVLFPFLRQHQTSLFYYKTSCFFFLFNNTKQCYLTTQNRLFFYFLYISTTNIVILQDKTSRSF